MLTCWTIGVHASWRWTICLHSFTDVDADALEFVGFQTHSATDKNRPHRFQIVTPERTYELSATDAKTKLEWLTRKTSPASRSVGPRVLVMPCSRLLRVGACEFSTQSCDNDVHSTVCTSYVICVGAVAFKAGYYQSAVISNQNKNIRASVQWQISEHSVLLSGSCWENISCCAALTRLAYAKLKCSSVSFYNSAFILCLCMACEQAGCVGVRAISIILYKFF